MIWYSTYWQLIGLIIKLPIFTSLTTLLVCTAASLLVGVGILGRRFGVHLQASAGIDDGRRRGLDEGGGLGVLDAAVPVDVGGAREGRAQQEREHAPAELRALVRRVGFVDIRSQEALGDPSQVVVVSAQRP